MGVKSYKKNPLMTLHTFKKVSKPKTPKKRSVGILSKMRFIVASGKITYGLISLCIGLYFYSQMPDVEKTSMFCLQGNTAATDGVVTKFETISYGPKGRNDYKVHYTYTVAGKKYTGFGKQSGLTTLEGNVVAVDYSVKNHSCSCARNIKCPYDDAIFAFIFGTLFSLIAIVLIRTGAKRVFNTIAVIEYGNTGTATVKNINKTIISRYKMGYMLTCEFQDTLWEKHHFQTFSKIANVVKTGDSLNILYDPGMPQNALSVDALPEYVKPLPA